MLALQHLDLTLPSPAENLACDEALLDWCEEGGGRAVLRFWEARQPFVVVGYANQIAAEVNVEACRARGVAILRRVSGGGTVVQGPGCLNYTLILPIDAGPELAGITGANRFIMERHAAALAPLLGEPVSVRGCTDLALGELKFSGNAQRRKRVCLLFHGTFLLDFDFTLVETLLRFPSRQPDYRAGRAHRDFLTRLALPAGVVRTALQQAWNATTPLVAVPLAAIRRLAAEKYSRDEWNFRW